MRILFITFYFPPYNSIGAVRTGKMAKYLLLLGHEVRVITAKDQPLQASLSLEVPVGDVTYTPWYNVNCFAELILGGRKRVVTKGYATNTRSLKWFGAVYKNLTNLPDGQIGWYPFAVAAGRSMISKWKPDVIFASGMPATSLLVAHSLAYQSGIPWVGELRDLWLDNPYLDLPSWRRRLESRLERKVMGTASGFVTVSDPLADTLRQRFNRPVEIVTNGFDPEDYPSNVTATLDSVLRIVYTGMLYEGRRDPTALFEAVSELGVEKNRVRIDFYGRYLDVLNPLIECFGLQKNVVIHEPVPHEEALCIMANADVLLLLLWQDPKEKGSFTGKLFEYLGARRPILVIGPEDNVAAQLVRDVRSGIVINSVDKIKTQLREWLKIKSEGKLPECHQLSSIEEYSRKNQALKLERFLYRLINGRA